MKDENAVYLRNKDYMETPEIGAADKERNDLFRYVAQTIETNLKCPLADKKAAATRLNYYLKPYRNAADLPLAQNTLARAGVGPKQNFDPGEELTPGEDEEEDDFIDPTV